MAWTLEVLVSGISRAGFVPVFSRIDVLSWVAVWTALEMNTDLTERDEGTGGWLVSTERRAGVSTRTS